MSELLWMAQVASAASGLSRQLRLQDDQGGMMIPNQIQNLLPGAGKLNLKLALLGKTL